MNIRYLITAALMFCVSTLTVSGLTEQAYIINNFEYEVDGMSRPWAIDNYLNTPESIEFQDYESMEEYARKQKQYLINLRIFKTVEVFLIPDANEDGSPSSFYTLKVSVVDAWTFFPILVPNYNSNDNFTLQLKVTYANLFGTLIDFSVDGDFAIGADPETDKVGLNYWNVLTSFSNINIKGVSFNFSWNQAYDRIIKKDGLEILEYYTFSKSDFFIATNFDLGNDYYIEVAPTFELTYNYQDKTGQGDGYIEQEPQSYGIYTRGGRDQLNWKGNFREGNFWEAELITRIVPEYGFKGQIILSNTWLHIFNERISYGNRILGTMGLRDEIYELGEYLRGVPDFNLAGNYALFFNNNFPIKVFNWKRVMEGQLHPFTDIGVVFPTDRSFSAQKDLRATIGIDGIIYPELLSTITLRASVGFDLFGPGTASERFEFLLSTSLFF